MKQILNEKMGSKNEALWKKIVTKSHHVHEEGEWHEDCDAKSQLLPRVWGCLEAKNHLEGKSVKIFPELCLRKIAKKS